jgi:hypothetical protein
MVMVPKLRLFIYWAIFYARVMNESRADCDNDPTRVPGKSIPRAAQELQGAGRLKIT